MPLAIFDLDNTLLAGDSDYLWGEFLVEQGAVDGESYRAANDRFYADYLAGTLDINAFLALALKPLSEHSPETLARWHTDYIEQKIRPILLDKAHALVEKHRQAGDIPMIITATNRFVTEPIAALYGIEHLIATEPEMVDGRYTGQVAGVPSFQQGKVARLDQWLGEQQQDLADSWFYSDSMNDLPLLEKVTHPVAVDPDERLRDHALAAGWPVISLR